MMQYTAQTKLHRAISRRAIFAFIAAVFLFGLQASPAHAQPVHSAWPMYGHDAQHTCQTDFGATIGRKLRWAFPNGSSVQSAPAMGADSTIYLGTTLALYALDELAQIKWSHFIPGGIVSTPAVDSNKVVYVGSLFDTLYAIRSDEVVLWKFYTGGIIACSPTIGPDGRIYLGSSNGALSALDQDGNLLW
jgi:hypothetical protein